MPITPTPMPYGFTSADIASMGRAREGLLAGFEALGQQVRQDMARIGTMRQLKGFGEELQQINPQSDLFAQQAAGVLSRYPLAASTPAGRAGIELLGRQNELWNRGRDSLMDAPTTRNFADGTTRQFNPGTQNWEVLTEAVQRGPTGTRVETLMREGRPARVMVDSTGQQVAVLGEPPPTTTARSSTPQVGLDVREMVNSRGKQVEELRILLTKPDSILAEQFKTDRPTVTRQILDLESEMRQIANPAPQAGLNSIGVDAQVPVTPPPGANRAKIQAATPLPTGRGLATESLMLMGPPTQAMPMPRVTGARPMSTPLAAQQVAPGTPAPTPEDLPVLAQPQRTVRNRKTGQIETLTLVDGQWQRLP